MKKVFIVLGNRYGEVELFRSFGWEVVTDMEESDLVVFTGGADINPELYDQECHQSVWYNQERDNEEVKAWCQALQLGKPILGICRGAQFVCVMLGGSLYQDAPHPGPAHLMELDDGRTMMTTSYHHQMLRPGAGAIIKAWTNNLAHHHLFMQDGEVKVDFDVEQEPEVVIYPEYRVLAVQGHPEFSQGDPLFRPFREYVFSLVETILEPVEALEAH